ncbi:carbohydrate-binding family 9-like protein [Aestuariibaculum suncheonense]|uniref:Carbohydrate-binding family 9-like protein n=1 Tax=Aestuariibaculum suncheonense TaxID=1028745 RepID=A0A8J6QF06_9FLAO|nr:carbohydrate-binding family 9-like protein [Aestuariibaculum suncheonense]MBD0835670.1 carbohydrate-binding family 9-like protein [Aestuariibaculum suncheonense]
MSTGLMNNKKEYTVIHIDKNQLRINGRGDSALWNQANHLTDFNSSWNDEQNHKVEFKALHDDENLYVSFKVCDSNIYVNTKNNSIESIASSDRVELFFNIDDKLTPYYCLEIDPTPRVLDFKANYYRSFDYDWNWPKDHIQVKSIVKANYFVVEVVISKESLLNLGLLKAERIQTGIYRAKYNRTKDGIMEPTWITWVDPDTDEPDFHVSSSFGILLLQER